MKDNMRPQEWYESESGWNCEPEDLERMKIRCRPVEKRKPRKILCRE